MRWAALAFAVMGLPNTPGAACANDAFGGPAKALLQRYCFDCHSSAAAEGQVNLERMTERLAFNTTFKTWEKVAAALESGKMPPKDAQQPEATERQNVVEAIRGAIDREAREHAGQTGDIPLRRLTSAEYGYTIRDLTGLDLDLGSEFVSDAAGGEGFTNVGTVQFFDDAGLERYLEAAKKLASHAVIGAGPLQFFIDPGKTGLELSAIDRIRRIYREHGFRTAAGEGGVPFGLEHYPQAFFVAWKYRNRQTLGRASATLEEIASEEGVPPRFARHIWEVLTSEQPSFPTSEIVARFAALPSLGSEASARAKCQELYEFMND